MMDTILWERNMTRFMAFIIACMLTTVSHAEITVPEFTPEHNFVIASSDTPEEPWHVFTWRNNDFVSIPYMLSKNDECCFTGYPGKYVLVNGDDYATTVIGESPNPPPPPPPPPESFEETVYQIAQKVEDKSKLPDIGNNYRTLAAQAAATPSDWTAEKLMQALKVANLTTLSGEDVMKWRTVFFLPVGIALAQLKLPEDDLKGHIDACMKVGKALDRIKDAQSTE
jgi:hypothetical protein